MHGDRKLVSRIEKVNLAISGLVVIGGMAFGSLEVALGILTGALVMVLSFQAMKWQVDRFFRKPPRSSSWIGIFIRYYMRFFATIVAVLTIILYRLVDPVAFLIGLSVVMMSIVSVGIWQALNIWIREER